MNPPRRKKTHADKKNARTPLTDHPLELDVLPNEPLCKNTTASKINHDQKISGKRGLVRISFPVPPSQ